MTLTASPATDALEKVLENAMIARPLGSNSPVQPNSEAMELATKLGLVGQAERYKRGESKIPQVFASSRLEGHEETVWRMYCPTRYGEVEGNGMRAISSYIFDTIPVPVLRHWSEIKEKHAFDSFEIWTTERTVASDPLLIGIFEGVRYLLARWGKEAPDLLPFAEVLEQIRARLRNGFDIKELPVKVAETIRAEEEKSPLHGITRHSHFNAGRFFFKKHCNERLMAFAFGGSYTVQGVCPSCGTMEKVGTLSYD